MIQTDGSYYEPVDNDIFEEHFVDIDEWRNIKIDELL